MSLGEADARSFFAPLEGRTTSFVVDDRRTNLSLLKAAVSMALAGGRACTILDLDALCSSHAGKVLSGLGPKASGMVRALVPAPGAGVEDELMSLFRTGPSVFVVETLNTLHHLMPSNPGSRSRRLSFVLSALSFLAKTNGAAGLYVTYRREKAIGPERGGSISDFADLVVSVTGVKSELHMRCERGEAWPDGKLVLAAALDEE